MSDEDYDPTAGTTKYNEQPEPVERNLSVEQEIRLTSMHMAVSLAHDVDEAVAGAEKIYKYLTTGHITLDTP